jgi:hypothetical protein
MHATDKGPAATTYEIVVKGEPGAALVADLGARRFEPRRGMTVIIVDIIDQSHLQGVLARLHDGNVEVERINPV